MQSVQVDYRRAQTRNRRCESSESQTERKQRRSRENKNSEFIIRDTIGKGERFDGAGEG